MAELPHDTYPVVISKLDPLMIRVSEMVLLVGSTSYTAKVKMSQLFNGFYVYVSSVGEPIHKEEVNISGHNSTNGDSHGEGSDAWRYIRAKARDWMDALESSMTKEDAQKNVVDLLREIKFQEHFDMTGYTTNSELYPNLELDVSQPVYMKSVIEKIEAIYDAIYGENGLNSRVTQINSTLTTLDGHIDEIEGKLQTIGDNVHTLDTNVHDDLNNIKSQLNTMNVTTLPGVADKISKAINDGLTSLVGQMNDMNTNIAAVDANVTTVDTRLTNNSSGLVAISQAVSGVGGQCTTITNDYLANSTYGLKAIKNAIGSSGGDISDIISTVSNIDDKLSSGGTIYDRLTTCWDVLYDGKNGHDSLYDMFMETSTRAFSWNSDRGEWTVNTELTKFDVLDDSDPDDVRVKAVV